MTQAGYFLKDCSFLIVGLCFRSGRDQLVSRIKPMLRIDAALGGQAEPSSRLVLLAAGVGQVVALPLIAWVDSEGVVSADHPPQRCQHLFHS